MVGVGVGELVLVGLKVGHGTHLSQILSKQPISSIFSISVSLGEL